MNSSLGSYKDDKLLVINPYAQTPCDVDTWLGTFRIIREVYLFTCCFYIFCKLSQNFSIENNNKKSFPSM